MAEPIRHDVPHDLTLAELEAWIAQDDPSFPDHAIATCPRCNGWGVDPKHRRCTFCGGGGTTTMAAWRRDLRAQIDAMTS